MALTISRRFSAARARSSFRRASSTGGGTAMDISSGVCNTPLLDEETLLLPGVLVGLACALHAGLGGHLGDGHVPPALVARHSGVDVDRHVDEDGLRLARRGSEGSLQLVPTRRVVRPGAQALGVLDEIDRDVVALEPAALEV